ncbi:hypothetical protein VTG60DRAFT_6567 [Thermothelomyces hinnuleus]
MDLGTVVAVIELMQKAIDIYERVEGLPRQMRQLGKRMELLNMFLARLQDFLEQTEPGHEQARLLPGQRDDLVKLLGEIQANAEKVHDLFYRYENGILSQSMGLTFRMSWAKQLWFSVVNSSADKVEAIMEDIDQQRSVLRDYLVLMSVEKAYEPRPPGKKPDKAALTTTTTKRHPQPSPSPAPPRRDYRILFVDPYNGARSVIAEAVVKLLEHMTARVHGDWRIAEARSAGFFTRRDNGCVNVIDRLDYSDPSFRLPWRTGDDGNDEDDDDDNYSTAMLALFDNKWADYPFKKAIRSDVMSRLSAGLPRDVFARFDFVFVFTVRDHDNMVKLKEALGKRKAAKSGSVRVSRGKCRVLQLGAYLAQRQGRVREIRKPLPTGDPTRDREMWNRRVSEIKTAIKGFLKQEMKWTPPDAKSLPASANKKDPETGKSKS